MLEDGITRVLLLSANPKDTDQLRLNEEFQTVFSIRPSTPP